MSEAAQASTGSAIKLGAEAAGRLLGFATTVVITRSLAAGEYGRFELAMAAAIVAAEAADFGLAATAGRDLVTRRVGLSGVVRAKLFLTLLLLCAVPVLWWLGRALAGDVPFALFVPLVVFFVVGGWVELLGAALRAAGRRWMEAATILVFRACVLSTAILFLSHRADLVGLSWTQAGATLPPLVLAAILARRFAVGEAVPGALDARALLRAARPLGLNAVLALVSLRVEIFAVARWGGGEDVGLYAVGQKVIAFLLMVPAAICAGAMPALVREAAEARPRPHAVRDRTATLVAILGVSAAVGLALVPGIVTLFGAAFAAAASVARLLALAVPFVFMNTLLHHALIAAGRGSRVARLTALRVLMAIGLAMVLVPRGGIHGAAVGFALAEAALCLLAARSCHAEGFGVPVVRTLALGLAVALPMAAVVASIDAPDLVKVAAGVATGAATVGLLLAARARVRV